jgi:serralysin
MIDANTKTAGDDAFKLIGNSAFHNVAGELQVKSYGDGVMVAGDVNGDGVADFQIYVHNISALAASNFYL